MDHASHEHEQASAPKQETTSELNLTPKPKRSLARIIILIVVLVLVIAIGGVAGWLAFAKSSALRDKVLYTLPVPIASVNSRLIMAKDFKKRFEVAQKFGAQQQGFNADTAKTQVYDQLIQETELALLASSKSVAASDKDIQQQFDLAKLQFGPNGNTDFENSLSAYGLNDSDFKNMIIKPQIVLANLVLWFNNQKDLNSGPYQKIDEIQQKLGQGQKFEDLAATYNQDPSSQGTKGDLGFITLSKTLPEFQTGLANAKTNDVKLIISRYGLHLMQVVETKQNADGTQDLHLRQIFIQPGDFSAWYQNQLKQDKVIKFIKYL